METPNEYVALTLAKDYMDKRLSYEINRNSLKSRKNRRFGWFFITFCRVISSIGHALIFLGKRLEQYRIYPELVEH